MNFKNFINIVTFALLLTSCTEIIVVNINSTDPQLVVEADIALNENATVFLSKSIDLDAPDYFEGISNATVKITDNEGNSETLANISSGVYKSVLMKGKTGGTYNISVETADKKVTATSKIPAQIPIDSFTVVNSVYPGGGSPRGNQKAPFYEIKLKYSDPANEENFYRIVAFYNGKPQARNAIFDDRFTNGKQMESTLIIYNDSAKAGDIILVEFQCIEKPVFNYFESMGNGGMGGPRGSSSPANPYTNLNGAILGYFSAHTVERKEWVLK